MSDIISNDGKIGFLDNIRLNNGSDCLISYFHDLSMTDPGKAAEQINDECLHYCSLFLLQHELEVFGLEAGLSGRNRTALRITRDIAAKDSEDMGLLTQGTNEGTRSVLKWMLGTGYPDDGMSVGYNIVMEHAAIQLTRTYKDRELLFELAEMIFARHRKGLLIHNLTWAFFEARSPESLIFVANRLCSTDMEDSELARRLLYFIPDISVSRTIDGSLLYNRVLDWVARNRNVMQYTGESLHQAVMPLHYRVSAEWDGYPRPDPAADETPHAADPAGGGTQPTPGTTGGETPQHPDKKIKLDEIKKKYPKDSIERKILDKLAASESDIRYGSQEELEFELRLRRRIIDASLDLYRSGLRFRTFHETECNERYWEHMENGGFKIRSGVGPSEGIRDIFINGRKYGTECATAMMMLFYKAVLDIYSDELFDRTFPDIILMNWLYSDNKLGVATYRRPEILLPGDCRYFRNPDVDPMTPEWQGENAIDLGDGTYYGHGVGIRDEESMIRVLNRFRVKGSVVSAYLMDTATRPDFQGLFKVYSAAQASS